MPVKELRVDTLLARPLTERHGSEQRQFANMLDPLLIGPGGQLVSEVGVRGCFVVNPDRRPLVDSRDCLLEDVVENGSVGLPQVTDHVPGQVL